MYLYCQEGIPITSPSYYANITKNECQHIFRSETPTEIPLLEGRASNLNEVGKILVKDYKNSFVNLLSQCDHSAEKLLGLITSTFKCFQDESEFDGKRVSFYILAWIILQLPRSSATRGMRALPMALWPLSVPSCLSRLPRGSSQRILSLSDVQGHSAFPVPYSTWRQTSTALNQMPLNL